MPGFTLSADCRAPVEEVWKLLFDPARVPGYTGEKTHLGRVRERRTQADGDRLMAESLARRDHPEEFNIWTGPVGRRSDPGRRT